MGFRMRRSFSIVPGVRVNVSARSMGLTVGGKYARTTINSRTGVHNSYSLPGTGLTYVTKTTRSSPRQRGTVKVVATPPPPVRTAPGVFAPRGEKHLYAALAGGRFTDLETIASQHPELRRTCMVIDAFNTADSPQTHRRVRGMFEELWRSGYVPERDDFLTRYAPGSTCVIGLAPGVSVTLPLHRTAVGLALAELRQEDGDLAEAADLVETLEPSLPAAASLAELYGQLERWEAVVELTEHVTERDELSLYLLIQRAAAFRELRHNDAARDVLRTVLARRSAPVDLRHLALLERGLTYAADGKKAQARKDLDRILAEDGHFPGLAEAIAALGT